MDLFDILFKNSKLDLDESYKTSVQKLYEELNSPIKSNKYYPLIYDWFKQQHYIHTLKIETYDKTRQIKNVIYHKGSEFEEDSPKAFQFSLNVEEHLQITYHICTDTLDHAQKIEEEAHQFKFLFELFTPTLKMIYYKIENENNSSTDTLTSLPNRTYLMHHLHQLMPLAQRENKKIGFVMIAVDHFKAVIDEFDYDIGDQVLIKLAQTIENNIRASDIAIRLNADEFFVTLPSISHPDDVLIVAQKLIDAFKDVEINVNAYTNQTLKKTICAGTTVYPDDSTSLDQLIKYADIALYEARNKGRSIALAYSQEETSTIDLF